MQSVIKNNSRYPEFMSDYTNIEKEQSHAPGKHSFQGNGDKQVLTHTQSVPAVGTVSTPEGLPVRRPSQVRKTPMRN